MEGAAQELLRIAKELVGGFPDQPVPWSKEFEDEVERRWRDAVDKLEKKLEKNKSFFWAPGRSLAVNIPLTGALNSWSFRLFSHFRRPFDGESLLVEPNWTPGNVSSPSHAWPSKVDEIIRLVKGASKISDVVDRQLDKVEQKLGIDIPADVRRDIQKYVKKVAKGRQTGNRLRVKPKAFPVAKEGRQARSVSSSAVDDLRDAVGDWAYDMFSKGEAEDLLEAIDRERTTKGVLEAMEDWGVSKKEIRDLLRSIG